MKKVLYTIGVLENEFGKRKYKSYVVQDTDIHEAIENVERSYSSSTCDFEIQSVIKSDAILIQG